MPDAMTTAAPDNETRPTRRRGFGDVLDDIRARATSEADKGRRFERLVKRFFQQDALYAQTFSNVYLWSEWPGNEGRGDTGIDVVAELASGAGLAAIQCKFYAPDAYVDKGEVDKFLSPSGKTGFVERIIVTTTSNWSRNALDALGGQQIPVTRLGPMDFEASSIDWAAFDLDEPEAMERKAPKQTREHQQEAINDVIEGFQEHDRGKLIMACGTGKTYAALRIAEAQALPGGTLLFLTPSLQLVSQSLREWANDKAVPMRFFAVCSDPSVAPKERRGADEDDAEIEPFEMVIPPTTSAEDLMEGLSRPAPPAPGGPEPLTVVFSTYQSLDVVIAAQNLGLGDIDLVICDEAHRTTGVTLADAGESEFAKVHYDRNVRAKKRLYMTATPRIYSERSKGRAREADAALASMDDEAVYGPEFHRLNFGDAVEKGLLCDYRVIIFGVNEQAVASDLQNVLSDGAGNLNLNDGAKIVASWNALAKQKSDYEDFATDPDPMRRVVAFAGRIQHSKDFAETFTGAVGEYLERKGLADGALNYVPRHVDGRMNAIKRGEELRWLAGDAEGEGECRILSNARCLTEGVDVPALDGVLFLSPRRSVVDVVQAVGRAMRKSDGKKYGYIVIPIAVAPDGDYRKAILDSNYNPTWQVLQALKAHDESFYDALNQTDLRLDNGKVSVIFDDSLKTSAGADEAAQAGSAEIARQIALPISDELRAAIYAKIVDSLTDKHYYRRWAKDVQRISEEYEARILALLESGDRKMRAEFDAFLESLRRDVDDDVTREAAVEMLGQHLVTKPVFDAFFAGGEFARRNPVAQAMDRVTDYLENGHAVENERKSLARFYESIHRRVSKVESAEAKQQILKDLYGEFFKHAMPKAAASLGIVYTPVEAVDFILRSVEDVLRAEFDASIAGEGVHILDPFVGTGTFIARILSGGFASPADLARKYADELWANDVVLLAYYVAAANIEAAYREAAGAPDYAPFPGIALADTFQTTEYRDRPPLSDAFIKGNSDRIERQKAADIRVIVGNPPWSIGQSRANDENKNREYPALRVRVSETYNKNSSAGKNNLDTYVQAIRWASDRIAESERGGVVAFITNGGFIDSIGGDGMRKSLMQEFHKVYCLNLRGDQRTAGEKSRQEGGKLFGAGSRASVAVLICVSKPGAPSGAALLYRDVGDYLTQGQKLAYLAGNRLADLPWQTIAPNAAGDWINQRSDEFQTFFPLYEDGGVFVNSSSGAKTNLDPWCWNFSKPEVARNVAEAMRFFNEQTDLENPAIDPAKLNWTRELRRELARGFKFAYDDRSLMVGVYRPFMAANLYLQSRIVNAPGKMMAFYPSDETENIGITVTENVRFSCLATNRVVDHSMFGAVSKYLPRWTYAPGPMGNGERERVSNISPAALAAFRKRYESDAITEDDLFHYCYGVLHHEGYRTKYANDLAKEPARVPMAASLADFQAFADAGRELADLHVNYESVEPYPLQEDRDIMWDASAPGAYRVQKMAYAGKRPDLDRTRIVYNEGVTLSGVPEIAHEYRLGSRSALDWLIDRYQIKTDKDSGIRNDPNDWAAERGGPRYVLDLVKRVTAVSVRTVEIVRALPSLPDCP